MSGCMHPIQFKRPITIKVNALQYCSILGAEKARILVNSNEVFKPGDEITIIEVTVNEGRPTGNSITRFVQYVESRVPLYLDDDAIAIHLVPIKSMVNPTQKV